MNQSILKCWLNFPINGWLQVLVLLRRNGVCGFGEVQRTVESVGPGAQEGGEGEQTRGTDVAEVAPGDLLTDETEVFAKNLHALPAGDFALLSQASCLSLPTNGKDGFHSVPNRLRKEWDGVESVLTSTFLGLMPFRLGALVLLTLAATCKQTRIGGRERRET